MIGIVLAAALFGPYNADLVRVIDGDTAELDLHVFPNVVFRMSVRESGVDTPEKRTKNECEKKLGLSATMYTRQFLLHGGKITVHDVGLGKYAGRVLGSIFVDGESLSKRLIEEGLARPYYGGTRQPWCND